MRHKGAELEKVIGQDNYDILFDVVNEHIKYVTTHKNSDHSIKRFIREVRRVKFTYF